MQIEHFKNIEGYHRTVKDYLLQQEATHCFMLGIRSGKYFSQKSYLAVVKENNKILAAAIRTPPPNELVLSKSLSEEAIAVIARDLASLKEALPGIVAPQPEALVFAKLWQSLTGKSYGLGWAQRIYQLEVVQPIIVANGYLRLANKRERSLLIGWIQAFGKEALGENEPEQSYQDLCDRRLHHNRLYIWQNDVPVSMAGFSGSTPNGIRINSVYTPPEHRSKGYASSCVAVLSQNLIEKGNKYCFLFADLANSTSNSIYQTIGYQPVSDVSNYWFEN